MLSGGHQRRSKERRGKGKETLKYNKFLKKDLVYLKVAKVCEEGCVWEAIISHYAYTKEEGIQLPCTKTKNLVKN